MLIGAGREHTDRERKAFLKTLEKGAKTGIGEEALADGLRRFTFRVDEVSWCLFEKQSDLRHFGMYAIARSDQRDRARVLFKMLAKESSAPRRLAIVQAIALSHDPKSFSELGKLANSKDVADRRQAQQVLVRIEGWPAQRELVSAFLDDPDTGLVGDMVRAIIEQDAQQYHGNLRHLAIHEDEAVRRLVLTWMIRQNDPSHAETFFNRLAYEGGMIRQMLLDALARLAESHPDAMLDWSIQSLADASPEVRRTGVQLFTRLLGCDGAIAKLMTYAASVTDWVRDTIYEEAKNETEAFVQPLLDYLVQERDDKLRFQALHFAYSLRDPRLIPLFLAGWERGDWVMRYQILTVLSEIQSPEAYGIMLDALNQKETRLLAVRGLGAYDDPAVMRRLRAIIEDADNATQLEILEVFRARGEARLVPFVARFLENERLDGAVHDAAVEVITSICARLDVPVPRRVAALSKRRQKAAIENLPDLGLRLVPDA